MNLLRLPILSIAATAAVLCAAPEGAAQSGDIFFDTTEPLQFQVRVAVSPGTQQVTCYQSDQLRVVGSSAASTSTVTVPISLPGPRVRCSACNSVGCSTLSPNAAVVVPVDPLDMDGNTIVDVRDMTMCYMRLREAIY